MIRSEIERREKGGYYYEGRMRKYCEYVGREVFRKV